MKAISLAPEVTTMWCGNNQMNLLVCPVILATTNQ